MKLRYILIIIVLISLIGIPTVTVFYYKFDPVLLSKLSFYMDLANPYMRIVRIEEGLRREEIAERLADKLNWDQKDKDTFANAHLALDGKYSEGHYFPKTYLIYQDETPQVVQATMFDEFSKQIQNIKKPKSKITNEDTILRIASIIQREAASKDDMNLISGIIWNRIWNGMKLQMDATLQYAKGSESDGWWREVNPEDRKIKSLYNTYLYPGLPPSAIANPGLSAIAAAYNPLQTKCLFYLHDKNKKIHCAKTYQEHKKNIKIYLK